MWIFNATQTNRSTVMIHFSGFFSTYYEIYANHTTGGIFGLYRRAGKLKRNAEPSVKPSLKLLAIVWLQKRM